MKTYVVVGYTFPVTIGIDARHTSLGSRKLMQPRWCVGISALTVWPWCFLIMRCCDPTVLQAGRRVVKGRRQNVVEVTLEGEGKLGLVFAKDSEPPEIKEVKPSGLAAKVCRKPHSSSHILDTSRHLLLPRCRRRRSSLKV